MLSLVLKKYYMYLKITFTILLIALFSCKKTEQANTGTEQILSVDAEIISPTVFKDYITLVADLLPINDIEIKAPISGVILQINCKEGQKVNKGDVLIQLDNRQYIIQLQALLAEEKLLLNEYKRKKTLHEIEAVSIEELEKIENRLIVIEAGKKNAELQIELTKIKAGFNGQIAMLDWAQGAYIQQGTVITQLVQNDIVKVNLQLPSSYAHCVKLNNEIWVKVKEDSCKAIIYAIHPSMDAFSRTLQVRAQMQVPPNSAFIPGTFAQVVLTVKQNNQAIVVPAKSVLYDINQQTVYIVKNGLVRKQVVETGVIGSESVEILKGLQLGDTLITSGLLKLKNDIRVKTNFPKSSSKI